MTLSSWHVWHLRINEESWGVRGMITSTTGCSRCPRRSQFVLNRLVILATDVVQTQGRILLRMLVVLMKKKKKKWKKINEKNEIRRGGKRHTLRQRVHFNHRAHCSVSLTERLLSSGGIPSSWSSSGSSRWLFFSRKLRISASSATSSSPSAPPSKASAIDDCCCFFFFFLVFLRLFRDCFFLLSDACCVTSGRKVVAAEAPIGLRVSALIAPVCDWGSTAASRLSGRKRWMKPEELDHVLFNESERKQQFIYEYMNQINTYN